MIPKYQILVKNKSGVSIGEFSSFFNLKYSDVHNYYGVATFSIPIDSPDAETLVSLRQYDIYIIRDGVVRWAGEQVNADVTIEANSPNLVTITCYSFIEQLNGRLTLPYVRYDATDQAEILKALVVESQARTNGNFGYTFAPIVATKPRDREYKLSNIFEAHVNMTNVINGLDIWCDTDRQIHYSSARGEDKSASYILELGVNIQRLTINDNFSSPANTVFAVGSSDGQDQIIESYVDAGARSTYLLREQTLSAIDVSEANTLIDKAQDLVNRNKQLVRTISVDQLPNTTPTIADVDVGDYLRFKMEKGRYDIDLSYRIFGYECSIGQVGEEYVHYVLGIL